MDDEGFESNKMTKTLKNKLKLQNQRKVTRGLDAIYR